MRTYKTIIFILLSSILLCTACTKEDLDDCLYSYKLSFQHLSPLEGEDILSDHIGHIHLFFYNKEMELVKKYDALVTDLSQEGDTYSLIVKLPAGDYGVVAWGGKGEDHSHIIEQDKHFSYQYSNTEDAKTARLNLLHNEQYEVEEIPTPFFHSINREITVSNAINQNNSQQLNFHWGTNTVKVDVELINQSTQTRKPNELTTLNTYITAENGEYSFDGKAFGTDTIKYIPKSQIVNTLSQNDFRVMTLYKDDKSMLIIERKTEENNTEVIYKKSLSSIILENPALSFETHNDFDITVQLPLLEDEVIDNEVVIIVNGWEIINSNEGIS